MRFNGIKVMKQCSYNDRTVMKQCYEREDEMMMKCCVVMMQIHDVGKCSARKRGFQSNHRMKILLNCALQKQFRIQVSNDESHNLTPCSLCSIATSPHPPTDGMRFVSRTLVDNLAAKIDYRPNRIVRHQQQQQQPLNDRPKTDNTPFRVLLLTAT